MNGIATIFSLVQVEHCVFVPGYIFVDESFWSIALNLRVSSRKLLLAIFDNSKLLNMSLADELLADLEDDEVLDDDFETETVPDVGLAGQNESNLESMQKQYASVRNLATIIDSDDLKRVMNEINARQSNDGTYSLLFLV